MDPMEKNKELAFPLSLSGAGSSDSMEEKVGFWMQLEFMLVEDQVVDRL